MAGFGYLLEPPVSPLLRHRPTIVEARCIQFRPRGKKILSTGEGKSAPEEQGGGRGRSVRLRGGGVVGLDSYIIERSIYTSKTHCYLTKHVQHVKVITYFVRHCLEIIFYSADAGLQSSLNFVIIVNCDQV
jgi:hypothetical protein